MQLNHRIPSLALSGLLGACGLKEGTAEECRLAGDVYGGIETALDWTSMSPCEGMPRPKDTGLRLRFSGPGDTADHRLALIVGLPDLAPGATGTELAANVTLIAEDKGRFFSTSETTNCWVDMLQHERISANLYQIGGRLYCVVPLAEVNGSASVTLGDVSFAGRVYWRAPQ